MKTAILSFVFLTVSTYALAIPETTDTSRISPWLGEFTGNLVIYNSTKDPTTLPMKIRHFLTDTVGTYGWHLIYGGDENKGLRAYFLKTIDEKDGHYIVDEKNSIFLDTYMIGNKLISDFEVDGTTITSIYTLISPDTITFEIIAGKSKEVNISGGVDDIPEVSAFPVSAYQFATLKRMIDEDK